MNAVENISQELLPQFSVVGFLNSTSISNSTTQVAPLTSCVSGKGRSKQLMRQCSAGTSAEGLIGTVVKSLGLGLLAETFRS